MAPMKCRDETHTREVKTRTEMYINYAVCSALVMEYMVFHQRLLTCVGHNMERMSI